MFLSPLTVLQTSGPQASDAIATPASVARPERQSLRFFLSRWFEIGISRVYRAPSGPRSISAFPRISPSPHQLDLQHFGGRPERYMRQGKPMPRTRQRTGSTEGRGTGRAVLPAERCGTEHGHPPRGLAPGGRSGTRQSRIRVPDAGSAMAFAQAWPALLGIRVLGCFRLRCPSIGPPVAGSAGASEGPCWEPARSTGPSVIAHRP